MNFEKCLNEYIEKTNACLHNIFDAKNGDIYEAMRYSIYAGGKRIRPVISLACCEALDGNLDVALRLGCSIEMIHTYSLIHDDLPCMDDDDFRRGKPTNHIVFGEDMAVLAGDALLNYACENIVNSDIITPKIAKSALRIIYTSSGAEGMIGGQVMDMAAEGTKVSEQYLKELHRKKTGSLIKAAASLGAISADKDETVFDAYSSALGLAFQIRDDILDVEADEKKLGKPVASDEKNNKTTYVTLYGIDGAKQLLKEETQKAVESVLFLGKKADFLIRLAEYLLNREY